jgi:lipoyl-dependent peroxiredoxin
VSECSPHGHRIPETRAGPAIFNDVPWKALLATFVDCGRPSSVSADNPRTIKGVRSDMAQEQTRAATLPVDRLRAVREAEATWAGSLFRGSGSVSAGSRAFAGLPITWASRTEHGDGKTSPEELLAAAHAGCFSMAFSLVLAEGGTPPEQLTVNAACTFEQVPDGFAITTIDLDVHGRVPGLDPQSFEQAAERAAQLCPVSKALRGNVEVKLTTRLEP